MPKIDENLAADIRETLLAARKAAGVEARENHGLAVHRSIQKGDQIALKTFGVDLMITDLNKAIGRLINPSLSVTPIGLVAANEYCPTELEVTDTLTALTGISEENKKLQTTISWAIGDAALMAERFDGGVDRVVVQAIKERGVTKHTVRQAIRACREYPYEERIAGASISHHQEILNYRSGIKDKAKLRALLDELRESAKTDDLMSCHTLRERLSEISTTARNLREDHNRQTYLYISEDGEIRFSEVLHEEVCSKGSHLVINVTKLEKLGPEGEREYSIPQFQPEKS